MQCRYCEQKSATRGLPHSRVKLPAHRQFLRQRRKLPLESFQIEDLSGVALSRLARARVLSAALGKGPLHAHEEEALLMIFVLIRVQDIGATLVEHSGDAGHQPFAIGAIDK